MAANILDELDDIFDARTVKKTAEALGESPEAITACIRPSVAALLRAIIKQCESRDAADGVVDTIAAFEGAVCLHYYLILEAGSTAETIELGLRASESLYRTDTSSLVYPLLKISSISRQGAESLFHLLTALVIDMVGIVHAAVPFRSDVLPMYLRKQQTLLLASIPEDILMIMGFVEVPKRKGLSQDQLGLNAFAPGPAVDFTPPIREAEFTSELLGPTDAPSSNDVNPFDESAGLAAISEYQAANPKVASPNDPISDAPENNAPQGLASESLEPAEQPSMEAEDNQSNDLDESVEQPTESVSREDVIKEIVRRQQLREKLQSDFGPPELPTVDEPATVIGVANERQQRLKELLKGGLGTASTPSIDLLENADPILADYDPPEADYLVSEDGQEYLVEVDDAELEGDDFLEGHGFDLSTEQNLEIRFKALLVAVLLCTCWLYAFTKGQRQDMAMAGESQAAATTHVAASHTPNLKPQATVRDHRVVTTPSDKEELSPATQPNASGLLEIDRANLDPLQMANAKTKANAKATAQATKDSAPRPMQLPPIVWTDATSVSLRKEPTKLLARGDARNVAGATTFPEPETPTSPVESGLPSQSRQTPRVENWLTHQDEETPAASHVGDAKELTVRFEPADESLAESGINGYQVVNEDLKIPVFDAPRESGQSYYSN